MCKVPHIVDRVSDNNSYLAVSGESMCSKHVYFPVTDPGRLTSFACCAAGPCQVGKVAELNSGATSTGPFNEIF